MLIFFFFFFFPGYKVFLNKILKSEEAQKNWRFHKVFAKKRRGIFNLAEKTCIVVYN